MSDSTNFSRVRQSDWSMQLYILCTDELHVDWFCLATAARVETVGVQVYLHNSQLQELPCMRQVP
jgi:hypothetical protein